MLSTQDSCFRLTWDTPAKNGSELFFSEESYNRLCHPETLEERLEVRFADIKDISKVVKYDRNQSKLNQQILGSTRGEELKLESTRNDEKKEKTTDLKELTQKDGDRCKRDDNKDNMKPYDSELTTNREKGLPYINVSYIPPPRKSNLNHSQQIRYLDLQAKYGFKRNDDFTEEERVELREFKALNAAVVEEQAEFQQYLQKLAQYSNHLDYEYIHPETRKFTEERTSHKKREVETYPKYYSDVSSFPIEGTGKHSNLIYIKSLLQMGHIPKMVLPNLSQGQNSQIPLNATLVGQQYPSVQSKPTDSSKWIHEQCSKDENAEFLAVTNQAHIVISSGALQCLVDNQPPQFLKEWELPVTVQEYEIPDGDKILKHRVVYVDRPFAQRQQHPREKNDKYFKYALMTMFAKPGQKRHNLSTGKTAEEADQLDRNKDMSKAKESKGTVPVKDVKNSEEKVVTANERKDNSVHEIKKGRGHTVDSDVFGFEESSMGDLETFGTVSKFSVSKEKVKRSDKNTGDVIEIFSDNCISSPKHKSENLDLCLKSKTVTSLPGLNTVGSAFTKVSRSSSIKCDSIAHFEDKNNSNEEILLESNQIDSSPSVTKSDTGLNNVRKQEISNTEKLCEEKVAPESCTQKRTQNICIEKVASDTCVSNDVISSSTVACSVAEVAPVTPEPIEIVNMEPRTWFKPQALELVSGDTQSNTCKSAQNVDDNHPNHVTRLPRQRCDSTSSCDSDKLVIDASNDLTIVEDNEMTETPASPSPASPDQELLANVTCKIIPVSLGDSPLRTSPTSPMESESFEWTPCKIIPLQRESEDENIIDNSQSCGDLYPPQSSNPFDSPSGKRKRSQVRGQVSSLMDKDSKNEQNGSDINQSKSRRSTRESSRKVKDNSEMEIGVIERNTTETFAVLNTRVTRSRKSRENCSDVSQMTTDTTSTRTRGGQQKKCVSDQSPMNKDTIVNKSQRVTRSSSLESEKSPPIVPRKRGRPRKNLSNEEETPPAVKFLKEENSTSKDDCSKNSVDANSEQDGVKKQAGRKKSRPRKCKSGIDTVNDDCENENIRGGSGDKIQVIGTSMDESFIPVGSFDNESSVLDLKEEHGDAKDLPTPEAGASEFISDLSDKKESALPQISAQVKDIFTSVLNSSLSSKTEDFEISIKSSGFLEKGQMETRTFSCTSLDTENESETKTKCNSTIDKDASQISDNNQNKSDTRIESKLVTHDGYTMPQTRVQTHITEGSAMSELCPHDETFDHTSMPKRSRISRISKQDHLSATEMDVEISPPQESKKNKNVNCTKTTGQKTHKATARGTGDGKPKSTDPFSLDSLLQMQEKMLQPKSEDSHHAQQQASEDLPSVFKTPEKQNVTYNLWSLGGFQVLVRCGYHGYVKDFNQQSTYVHVMPKLEYQTKYGWEQLTYSEIAKSWISTYIRPNCKLLRARVNAQKSELLSIEELAVSQTLSQIFSPANCFLMLQNIFHKLHQLDVGKYILQHVTSSNKCVIKKSTEDNKRGRYDLHFAHLGFVTTENISKKRVPWIPIDPNIRLPYHTVNGRIPATFEPTDFKISQQRKAFKGGNRGKKKKKKKRK